LLFLIYIFFTFDKKKSQRKLNHYNEWQRNIASLLSCTRCLQHLMSISFIPTWLLLHTLSPRSFWDKKKNLPMSRTCL
jgi:hypothetical protein